MASDVIMSDSEVFLSRAAPSCTKPLMTISSEVCFTDHADFYSISGCGMSYLLPLIAQACSV